MIIIQYRILRYMPERVSGEFVNLGIVAFDPSTGTLKSKFITKIGKISGFFPNINSRYLVKSVKTIQDDLDIFSTRLQSEFLFKKISSLEEITKSVLPKDDSSLIFSEIKKTLDISVEATVDDLFSRFVSVHLLQVQAQQLTTHKDLWN